MKDVRLQRAFELLEQGGVEVLSLDVFDTLLWRVVPEPVDAFAIVGGRLRAEGRLARHVDRDSFAALRARAEHRARDCAFATDRLPEVDLLEIYGAMPATLFAAGAVEPAALAAIEVAVERELTVPDLAVAELARRAVEQYDARLVLVSDTYFSEDDLRSFLDREPTDGLKIDRIFVSNQHGCGKASGLWDIVVERVGADPSRILHIGDHKDADVTLAEEAGLRAVHFPKRPAALDGILAAEGFVAASPPRQVALDPQAGDLGLTALRARALSVAESVEPMAANGFWRFGASVAGPVFTAFAEWIVDRAEAEGIERVHCVMREGEFLGRLVNGAAVARGSAVRAVPLWLSRQVCARAAIADVTPAELRAFLNRKQPPTVRALCESLGIDIGSFPELHGYADQTMGPDDVVEPVVEFLSSDERARARVAAAAAALRQRLVAHVRNVVGPGERALLADLGWGGTIQERLDAALRAAGDPLHTHGLYLLTSDAAVDRALDGLVAEGHLASFGLPAAVSRWTVRSPEILEQICMVDAGSLVDIAADGGLVHAPVAVGAVQTIQRVSLQEGVLAFQALWHEYRPALPPAAWRLGQAGPPLLRNVLTRFVVQPTAEEAALFGAWLHDDNFGSDLSDTVITDGIRAALRYMTPRQLTELPVTRVYWPFGAAALHNPPLAMAAAAFADGTLPSEAFAAGDAVTATLLVDAGGGWDGGDPVRVEPSPAGRYLLRGSVPADRIRGVAVETGVQPGVLRIDWLDLLFHRRGGPPEHVRLDGPDGLRGLQVREAVRLAPDVAVGYRRGPTLVFTCPTAWSEDAYRVDAELAFGWLPTGPLRAPMPSNAETVVHLSRRAAAKARNVWLTARRDLHGRPAR